MKKSKFSLLFLLFATVVTLASGVSAKATENANKLAAQDKKQKFAQEKCVAIQAKVDKKVNAYEAGQKRHMSAYINMQDRLGKFVVRLSAAGYDTKKLEEDMVGLKELISTFSEDYASFIGSMRTNKSYACIHTAENFDGDLVKTRDLMKKVQADSLAIKNYYKTTIKVDLMAIKAQTPTLKDEDSSTGSGSTVTGSGSTVVGSGSTGASTGSGTTVPGNGEPGSGDSASE